MTTVVVGVDGCRAGWLAISYGESGPSDACVFDDIGALCEWAGRSAVVLIDIPIGLCDSGRECDGMARKLLGAPRAASIFTPPCRRALWAGSWTEACRINEEVTGRRLSQQSWAIAPRIREVDEYLCMDPRRQGHLREVHPEVVFWALNGKRPLRKSKKRMEGKRERLDLLQAHWREAIGTYEWAIDRLGGKGVARDDILDAMAAVAAWRVSRGSLVSIPATASYDRMGLRMEILYPDGVRSTEAA